MVKIDNMSDPFATKVLPWSRKVLPNCLTGVTPTSVFSVQVTVEFGDKLGELLDTVRTISQGGQQCAVYLRSQ